MPLVKGPKAKTKKGFAANVKKEMKSGKPQKQSLAIAYNVARKGKEDIKAMAKGAKGAKKAVAKKKGR
jgi:hypothetical protein